jgi:hypothetical protein
LEAAWDASRTIDGVQYPKPQYFLQGIANVLSAGHFPQWDKLVIGAV